MNHLIKYLLMILIGALIYILSSITIEGLDDWNNEKEECKKVNTATCIDISNYCVEKASGNCPLNPNNTPLFDDEINCERNIDFTWCRKSSNGYLKILFDLLNKNKNKRNTKVLINDDNKYKISGIDYTQLNDHTDIIDCYTDINQFIQTTPDLEFTISKINDSLKTPLDVIYHAKSNSKSYPWAHPLELGDINFDGSTKVLYHIYKLISTATKTITITSLGHDKRNYMIEDRFLTIIKNGILKAVENSDEIHIRLLVGGPIGYLKISQLENTINFLTADSSEIQSKCNIICINHTADHPDGVETEIWNHSKIIMVDGSSIRIGGQNMFPEYLVRDYYQNQGGPIADTNLVFFTKNTIMLINFINQLCYQSLFRPRGQKIYIKNRGLFKLTDVHIRDFSNIEVDAASKADINKTIFNNPIEFKSILTFKYNNKLKDMASLDADEQSRILSMMNIAKETIYISQQRLIEKLKTGGFIKAWKNDELIKSMASALNRGVIIKCILSRPDFDDGYSSNLNLFEFGRRLISQGCLPENLKNYQLKYFNYWKDSNKKSAQHTKMWCIDEKLLSIGSHNFYGSPLQQASIIIDSPALIEKYLQNDFWTKWENGIDLTPGDTEYIVYIVRHGEKQSKTGSLNSRGQARARNLINVFNGERFAKPNALYAHHYGNYIDKERCEELIKPISEHLKLPVNNKYGYLHPPGMGNTRAGEDILKTLRSKNIILVVWEHNNIQLLTHALGVGSELNRSAIPEWPSEDFDTIYELHYNKPSKEGLYKFTVSKQNFN
uniref:PLD phosphodiesterase domain-containing protein n=1 Tax=viral metagenome TaxID=1070528 RepID=A0A6C0FB82_9ZZZZ|tara:strand:+ start:488 stop:2830 length:2343 start_codon:yes stop_codon:yes gene_type:complete